MHMTRIVKTEQKSDEAIAVTIRCCNDPKTDSSLTIYGLHAMDQADVEAKVVEHHQRVAGKCDAMGKAKNHLANLTTKTMEHK